MQSEAPKYRIQDTKDTIKENIGQEQIGYRQETRSNEPRGFTGLYLTIHIFIQ